MSFPNVPNVTPEISISREDVINLLLASVAFEELSLAHIINAEAEKIQAVLGTLPNSTLVAKTIPELLSINQSVNSALKTVLKTQMLLQFKLEDIFELLPPPPTIFKNTATATGFFNNEMVTSTDDAYYHT